MGRRNRFTLIELLVVIAIIAILASLLLPSLRKAKEKANSMACIGNLKQVMLGMLSYTDDNDQFLPTSGLENPAGSTDRSTAITWDEAILPYLGSTELFQCPSDPLEVSDRRSYSANGFFLGVGSFDTYMWVGPGPILTYGRSMAEIGRHDSPSRWLLITERWDNSTARTVGRAHFHSTCETDFRYSGCHMRPNNANCGFADGHVGTYWYQSTVAPSFWHW